jgi:hypothetical protein
MPKTKILDPNKSYTFSRYAEMPFGTGDILAEFGVGFEARSLDLRQVLPIDSSALRLELEENLTLVDPSSEIARREALIFPVLKTVCKFSQSSLRIEYPVRVNAWLRGTLDYFLPFAQNLVVIEAKNADLARGFTQLAVELIALDQWVESETPIFYGGVTTGATWQFGRFDRTAKLITKDIQTYSVPSDLDRVLGILFGMSTSS